MEQLVVVGANPAILLVTMTDLEQDILNVLNELAAGVSAIKTADPKPNLVPLFNRLNEYATRLPRDTHGQLSHYLQNGSYDKARLWLSGRDSENARGLCAR
jgi:hypothetical protein